MAKLQIKIQGFPYNDVTDHSVGCCDKKYLTFHW